MTYDIVFAKEAINDLDSIFEYIADEISIDYCLQKNNIVKAVSLLCA